MYIVQPAGRAVGFDRFFARVLDSATFIGGVKLNVFGSDIR